MYNCKDCNVELTENNWSAGCRKSKKYVCRPCHSLRTKRWVVENPNYKREHKYQYDAVLAKGYRTKHRTKVREEVLTFYGNGVLACVKCGFADSRALSIDHIHGSGNKHRKELGNRGGVNFYSWLKINNFPSGFQTLCMNCQFIKRHTK